MRVLVVHGSKRGGTAGLAEMVGEALRAAGVESEVRPARAVRAVEGYDAVVVGGALYAMRWHRDARRFVRRHARALRGRPVWLFSSGPLDASAAGTEIPPVRQVNRVMERIGARGHVTFGGRLAPDARGFPARAMAKTRSGDWRDRAHVQRWVDSILAALRAGPAADPGPAPDGKAASDEGTLGDRLDR
jgi:menaquinone-dependent protoporphyrinogen oxidase